MTYNWKDSNPTERLTDRSEVQPPKETTFAEAQQYTNFVVFRPEWIPSDCTIMEVTLRPEQPPGRPGGMKAEEIGQTPWTEANPCSVRAVFKGKGRSLRLKQFLYDWAPPAASTAPLWGSPQLTPFRCQDAVGWLGTDYMARQGACVQLMRTQVELSVQEGEFTSQELQSILEALAVADLDASGPVRDAPFHQINYWARFQLRAVNVPHGLWRYSHARHYDRSKLASLEELRSRSPLQLLIPLRDLFVFDSAVIIEDELVKHREVELIFRHGQNHSDHLWMIAMKQDSNIALSLPPEPDKHQAEVREAISLRNTTVWYAALNERYGAWEAFWEENRVRYAVWAATSQFLGANRFKALIEALRAA